MKTMALVQTVKSAKFRSPITSRRKTPSTATAITNLFGMRRDLMSPYAAATKRTIPTNTIVACSIFGIKTSEIMCIIEHQGGMEAGQTRFHPKWVKRGRLGRGEIRGDRGEHG